MPQSPAQVLTSECYGRRSRKLAAGARVSFLIAFLLATSALPGQAQQQLNLFKAMTRDSQGNLIVTVNERSLDKLHRLPAAIIADFPASASDELVLELQRTEPTAGDAVLTLSGGSDQALPIPAGLSYFTGRVAGEARSSVLLIVSGHTVRGFVARGSNVLRFRPEQPTGSAGGTPHVIVSGPSTNPAVDDESACPVDSSPPQPIGGAGVLQRHGFLRVPIAIEVTPEVVDAFANHEELIEYVLSLVTVASIPYQRDTPDDLSSTQGVSLQLAHLNIMLKSENRLCDGMIVGETHCSGSGQFCFQDINCAPGETCITPGYLRRAQCFRDHWLANFPNERVPRALAVQLWRASAPGAGGYCMHLSTLCYDEYSYAWAIVRSDPDRGFRPRYPEDSYFASILTHEVSHLFGAVHPECIDPPPPLEVCRNDDSSSDVCWRGATADTAGGSTVMTTFGCSALASPLTFVPLGLVNVPGIGLNPFPDSRMAKIVRATAEAATACVSECSGPDTDGDSIPDECDLDDDNDGVLDTADPSPWDPDICGNLDGDSCDDCGIGADDFGPENDCLPHRDGPDIDCDGVCDASDTDLSCVGDCNLDCNVYVDEIVTLIAIALGQKPVEDCIAADHDGDDMVTVDECVRSVHFAMHGCSAD